MSDLQLTARDREKATGIDYRAFFGKNSVLFVLLAMLLFNALFTPNFFALGTIWNIVIQSCTILLVSMGMTMVISSGGIDISVGSVMAIASMVSAKMLVYGVVPAILSGLAVGAVSGLFSGFLIAKFRIQPIIVTLTVMISGRGIAQVINEATLINFTSPEFSSIGTYRLFGVVPIQILFIAAAVAFVYLIIEKTSLGRYIQSVGDNASAAHLAGINTFKMLLLVYMITGILAGFAGMIETARLSAADGNAIGKLAELDAIAAVAVGGTSMRGGRARVIGTVIGAVIMQLITIMVNMNDIPFEYARVIKSLIIILAVYLQREKKV